MSIFKKHLYLVSAVSLCSFSFLSVSPSFAAPKCLINKTSIAGIKFSDTLESVKKRYKDVKISMEQGAEVASAVLTFSEKYKISVYGEGINNTNKGKKAKFSSVETFDENCKTEENIGPGSTIKEAMQKFGKITNFMVSEIESREYITFENNKFYDIRVYGAYNPEQKIEDQQNVPQHVKIVSVALQR